MSDVNTIDKRKLNHLLAKRGFSNEDLATKTLYGPVFNRYTSEMFSRKYDLQLDNSDRLSVYRYGYTNRVFDGPYWEIDRIVVKYIPEDESDDGKIYIPSMYFADLFNYKWTKLIKYLINKRKLELNDRLVDEGMIYEKSQSY